MKISQIIQETSTTAGSVAPTEHGFVKMQTRNPSVYGGNKVGNLLKGKKTSKPFANSLNEAAMKDLAYDLQTMKPAEFQKKYGKSREEMKASMSKQPQQKPTPPVNETELSEQDLIVVPGQGRSVKTGFVPHDKDRTDHEVEMAVSDLFSAGKNAEKIYNIVRSVSEEEGLEGWVQEKIIKANDYLNTVREYLEGKQLRSVTENNQRGDSLVTDALKIMRGAEVGDAVKALKTVLGDREYNSRRGFYNFYIRQMIDAYGKKGVAEAGFPGAPDVEMPPMKPSGDPQRDKLKQEYMDLHREIKSLVDIPYSSNASPEQKMQAKARIKQLNDRADQIKAILEPRQPPNEWQKKTYGYDDNWNIVKKGVAEGEGKLDELSPQALGSYVKSAASDMANRKGDTQFQKGARVATSAFNSKLPASRFEKDAKIEKRQAGIDRAVDKITSKK